MRAFFDGTKQMAPKRMLLARWEFWVVINDATVGKTLKICWFRVVYL